MRILVIGSGGREHALVWKLRQSPQVSKIFVAPGNGGTSAEGAENVPVAADDLDGLTALALRDNIDLVVPGPELPLTLGIVDKMKAAGIACFGPDAYAAQMEGSKAFAKQVMARAGVPTASCVVCDSVEEARHYVREQGRGLVVKADGLAAGKGVVVARDTAQALAAVDEIMDGRAFGAAGKRVLLEELLEGEEVSLLCFCDGERAIPLPSAQDHKAACNNDEGPNTGGMGAYSPAPVLPDSRLEELADLTIRPVLKTLAEDGHPFVGVLYAGLMMTSEGPRVLEYNTRFGDPECQPLLMRLEGDLAQIMLDCVHGRLDERCLACSSQTALGVVLTAAGYPGSYPRGMSIQGIEKAESLGSVKVFHSGTAFRDGALYSDGGRVLCVTALGADLTSAQQLAYTAMEQIHMPQSHYRTDIGSKGIRRLTAK